MHWYTLSTHSTHCSQFPHLSCRLSGLQVRHGFVEREHVDAIHVKSTLVQQAASSRYALTEARVGAALSRHDVGVQQVIQRLRFGRKSDTVGLGLEGWVAGVGGQLIQGLGFRESRWRTAGATHWCPALQTMKVFMTDLLHRPALNPPPLPTSILPRPCAGRSRDTHEHAPLPDCGRVAASRSALQAAAGPPTRCRAAAAQVHCRAFLRERRV